MPVDELEKRYANLYKELPKIPDIRTRSLMVETESTGSFIQSIGTFFTSKLESIKEFFKSDAEAYKIKSDPFIAEVIKTYNSNKNKLLSANYLVVSKKMIPYPELFAKNLYDTILILKPLATELDSIFLKTIDNTDTFVSKAINDPDFIKSTRPFNNHEEIDGIIERAYSGIDKLINPEKRVDKCQIQEAIPNITSINDVVEGLKTIHLLSMYKSAIQADKISKSIKSKIDTLVNQLRSSKQNEVSKMGLSQLATEIERSAKLITLMGTTLYITSQTASATTTVIKAIVE